MRPITAMLLVLLTTLALPRPAAAAALAPAIPAVELFGVTAVDEASLAQTRGGQSPFATLTVGAARRMADAVNRADFRQIGSIARVESDIWFGSVGAEMIATNVRGAGAP